MSDSLHQIGEVAERAGLSLRTVRYYEEQGLVTPETRTDGGFRLYADEQVERLRLLKQMKPLGFTIREMRQLLDARDVLNDGERSSEQRRAAGELLERYAAQADERCIELRAQLRRAEALTKRLRADARGANVLTAQD